MFLWNRSQIIGRMAKKMGDARFAALAQGLAEIGTPGLISQYFKISRSF